MAVPQVSLPVPYEQIPAEVKRLRDHARGLRLETDLTSKVVQAVQECCPHPKEHMIHSTDRAGYPESECRHCGKEW